MLMVSESGRTEPGGTEGPPRRHRGGHHRYWKYDEGLDPHDRKLWSEIRRCIRFSHSGYCLDLRSLREGYPAELRVQEQLLRVHCAEHVHCGKWIRFRRGHARNASRGLHQPVWN